MKINAMLLKNGAQRKHVECKENGAQNGALQYPTVEACTWYAHICLGAMIK